MTQINLEDVKKYWEFRKLCNTTPLKDVEFMWEGKPVTENPTMIKEEEEEVLLTLDEWLFTGLNNIDYIV